MKPFLPIELLPGAPVVFVLDRTESMAIRDCPQGMSRWEYALGALREGLAALQREARRVTLITFGRYVHAIEDCQLSDLEFLSYGDQSRCTGQAAAEALWFSAPRRHGPEGAAVLISNGIPEQDTRIGQVFLGTPSIMRTLFIRTCFLTVGKPSEELQRFAELWPIQGTLESVMEAGQVAYGASSEAYTREEIKGARRPF